MSKKSLAQFKKNVGRYKLVREAKKEIASYKVEPKSKGGRHLVNPVDKIWACSFTG